MSNKIVVMLFYYERPNMVKNALRSVIKANEHYQNWFLIVFDDGSQTPVEPIVHEVMGDSGCIDRVGIIRNDVTVEQKVNSGGMLGYMQNRLVESSIAQMNPDAFVILCDDDELHPEYLKKLDEYLTANPDVLSCYSKVIFYNPLEETSDNITMSQTENPLAHLNKPDGPINGACMVDASQVAFRPKCYEMGARFPYPATQDQDAGFYSSLFQNCGPMHPTGFVSQYKGVHGKQLGKVGAFQAWTNKDIDK